MIKATEIGKYVKGQIALLVKDGKALEYSGTKARLAQLRRGVGKKPGELPELWGVFLKNIPEDWMCTNGEPTYVEWAVYTALTLFALHQQGHCEVMHAEEGGSSLGQAARKLVRSEEDEENIRRKLSIVAKSEDMTELSYHLKTIIRLFGNNDIRLNYAELAEDLYWFQFEQNADEIRLKWGRDFYRNIKTEDKGKGECDEE